MAAKKQADLDRILRTFEGSEVQILKGRWGPYITDGKKNAKIPKEEHETAPSTYTLEHCLKLIEEAPEPRGKKKGASKKASAKGADETSAKKPAAKKKKKKARSKKSAAAKKAAAKKAAAKRAASGESGGDAAANDPGAGPVKVVAATRS